MNKFSLYKNHLPLFKGFVVGAIALFLPLAAAQSEDGALNEQLARVLAKSGFTGTIESTLERRLGRPINEPLAQLGQSLFFDNIQGLHKDNSCAGCHAPAAGFGDTQSVAIGVDNNNVVGPQRQGPRNQRRSPMILNTAFFPKLMWNGRVSAISGDPFDNSQGFLFPAPEGATMFPPNDPQVTRLLVAQGHIPQTELPEMTGFSGTQGTISPEFDGFDDGHGSPVPPPGADGFRNTAIREVVLTHLNDSPAYRSLFAENFPEVQGGGPITFAMIGQALAEFQTSLTFANAPIDQFARGVRSAMTASQKRGALLFFGKAKCVQCHAVAGKSNEMFSDFEMHVLAVPQIAPLLVAPSIGNVAFDGPGRDEDFGLEQFTGNPNDRYRFRSSPLRNVALQPTFFHNGAFTRLSDAIRHHLNVYSSLFHYDPIKAGVAVDLAQRRGPSAAMLIRLDPLIRFPIRLSDREFGDLVSFVSEGLLDPRLRANSLCAFLPTQVPSGIAMARFEGCN